MKDIISRIKSKAKQLTIDISQIGDGCTKEQLHGDSLELLLDIHELETSYNKACQDSPASPKIVKGVTNQPAEKEEDVIRNEINKMHRKLPSWAKKQHQINSKILTLFLQLEEEGIPNITEQMLMEKYGDRQEFYTNFAQMKAIAPKNHGKAFDVQNGVVKIWEPIIPIVQEYKNAILPKNS